MLLGRGKDEAIRRGVEANQQRGREGRSILKADQNHYVQFLIFCYYLNEWEVLIKAYSYLKNGIKCEKGVQSDCSCIVYSYLCQLNYLCLTFLMLCFCIW